eukprot:6205396-Amphidinium_carterae.1
MSLTLQKYDGQTGMGLEVLVEEDVVPLAVLGGEVLELVNANVVEFVDVREEVLGSGRMELVVLAVEVEDALLVLEDVLVDDGVDTLVKHGSDASELVDANVVEDVDVHEEDLGDVGIVELVVLAVEVEDDLLVFEDEVEEVELDVLVLVLVLVVVVEDVVR